MLRPRIIPCLLVHNKGLVKTIKFKDSKYIGDPINAVRIFNEKGADELIILDIDASVKNIEPDYKMIDNLATECRMPLCYGGGIKTIEQAQKIFSLGVEKIAISSAAIKDSKIVSKIALNVGSQSVVIVLDIKRQSSGNYELFINNGKTATGLNPFDFAKKMQDFGAGEIVINSIDNDGCMNGYDIKLVNDIRNIITLPLTVLGGAGKMEDIGDLINKYGIIGAAAGSLFVFKGKFNAVLINYPNWDEKDKLINTYIK